jgi:hypothetical protein
MLLGEDAEDFVSESLADGGHIFEIEEDLSESLKSGNETLGLGTGDQVLGAVVAGGGGVAVSCSDTLQARPRLSKRASATGTMNLACSVFISSSLTTRHRNYKRPLVLRAARDARPGSGRTR